MTSRTKRPRRKESFAAGVGRGLRRAARSAREIARMYGTPIYVWRIDILLALKGRGFLPQDGDVPPRG
jgi:hypothetical protein